jgi:hypothetical protein
MKKLVIIFLIIFSTTFQLPANAVKMVKVKPEKLYEMQNRTFQTDNIDDLWNAVITTLYDSDFIIEDIDKDLGHIRAIKTYKSHYINKKRIAGWSAVLAAATAYTVFSYGSTAYCMYSPTRRIANEMRDKTIVIDTNINIEKLENDKTNVKFVLVEKILQNADGFSFNSMAPVRIIRIYTPETYNEFFNQVENNLKTNL